MNRIEIIERIKDYLLEITDRYSPIYSEEGKVNYPDKILMVYHCDDAHNMFRDIKNSRSFFRRMKELEIWKPNVKFSALNKRVSITIRFFGTFNQ